MILINKPYVYYNFHENESPFLNQIFSKIFWITIYLLAFYTSRYNRAKKQTILTLNCKLSSFGSIYISKHLWGRIFHLSWCLLKNYFRILPSSIFKYIILTRPMHQDPRKNFELRLADFLMEVFWREELPQNELRNFEFWWQHGCQSDNSFIFSCLSSS